MEHVTETELRSFFAYVVGVLERLHIPYMVVGGFAAIMYGEPRLTIDVDIVVDIKVEQVKPFAEAFPIPDYYASEEGIRDSLQRRYAFNVIQPLTGAKVDLVPLPADPFTRAALQRRRRLKYDESGNSAVFITAEDVVIAKLIAHRKSGSDKHLRDAEGVMAMQWGELDLDAIRCGARASGTLEQFESVLTVVRRKLAG